MHSKSPAKRSSPHQQRSSTVGTVQTPRSTPSVCRTTPRSMTQPVGGDVSQSGVTISDETRLRELFNILKGYDHVLLKGSPKYTI